MYTYVHNICHIHGSMEPSDNYLHTLSLRQSKSKLENGIGIYVSADSR